MSAQPTRHRGRAAEATADMIVTIATPLETELVERIRAIPVVTEVLYDPKLMPRTRYPCDHIGDPAFVLDDAARARLDAMLARADVLLGYPRMSPRELARALEIGPTIRFVQGMFAGMGSDVRAAALAPATFERVRFASAAGIHGGMLAEFAFYGLLALRKDARRLATLRRERAWDHFAMGELDGSTIGIVGMGGIGRAIAVRARAFGMHVIAIARSAEPQPLADETFAIDRLGDAFARCDAVVVTLPGTEVTKRVVSAEALDRLKPSAIFANVGRGSVVDQDALLAMLLGGRLAGAVLDVCDPEPLPPEHPFWTLENVIFSPHTAALSIHENERVVDVFCENLARFDDGRPLRNALNVDEFY